MHPLNLNVLVHRFDERLDLFVERHLEALERPRE
jgi:hypothetical protein